MYRRKQKNCHSSCCERLKKENSESLQKNETPCIQLTNALVRLYNEQHEPCAAPRYYLVHTQAKRNGSWKDTREYQLELIFF